MTEEEPDPSPAPREGRFKLLAPIYLSVLLLSFAESALHVLVPPYLSEELQVRPGVIGSVVSIFGIVSLLMRVPIGTIYTVARARTLLVAGGLLCTSAYLLLPFFSSVVVFSFLWGLDGVGWSTVSTTLLALLVATRPAGLTTAAAMGWYSAFTGLGHTFSGVTAGWLADSFGFRTAFLVLAGLPLLATVVLMVAIPWRSFGADVTRREGSGPKPPAARRRWFSTIHDLSGLPPIVWSAVTLMVYINVVNGLLNAFHPVFVLAAGLSLTQVGTLASVRSFASSTSRMASGWLLTRLSAERLTMPLLLLGTIPLMLLPTWRAAFHLQVVLFLALGVARGLLRVTASVQAFDSVGEREREHGLIAAVLHGGLDLGKSAGPLVGGFIAEVVGLAGLFHATPILVLGIFAALRVRTHRISGEDG